MFDKRLVTILLDDTLSALLNCADQLRTGENSLTSVVFDLHATNVRVDMPHWRIAVDAVSVAYGNGSAACRRKAPADCSLSVCDCTAKLSRTAAMAPSCHSGSGNQFRFIRTVDKATHLGRGSPACSPRCAATNAGMRRM